MTSDILVPTNPQDNLQSRTFTSGELILLEPNVYWLLQQGIVKAFTWTEEKLPITLGYWGVNDLLGQSLSLVDPYQVQCLTTVRASCIPVSQASRITNLILHQIRQTEELLYIMRTDKIYPRLRKILLWLSRKFGEEVEIGRAIALGLTHQDLAEIVGASRVTITKGINQLEQEGFLTRLERNTIIVRQL